MPAAIDNDPPIWRDDDGSRTCRGMIRKRHLLALGAFVGAVVLIIGLTAGRSGGGGGESSRAVGQAADPASLGCFNDKRRSRVLGDKLVDKKMTPKVGPVLRHALGSTEDGRLLS